MRYNECAFAVGRRPTKHGRMLPLAVLLAIASSDVALDMGPPDDSFVCYKPRFESGAFSVPNVHLNDAFSDRTDNLRKGPLVCTPARVATEGTADEVVYPLTHLQGDKFALPATNDVSGLAMTDQFGTLLLDLRKDDFV